MVMQRIDPFHRFRRMDEVFNNIWHAAGDVHPEQGWAIPVDVLQTADSIVLKATLPGFAPEHIDVSIEGRTLTISAENTAEASKDGQGYIIRERRAGKYHRALRLPRVVNTDNVDTQYRHGVLTLTFSKLPEVTKARRLEITSG